MLCRNCGKEVNKDAFVCTNCGFEPLAESNYCQECGASSKPNQKICLGCGFELLNQGTKKNTTEYAGFWRRFAAYFIDTIILTIISLPLILADILLIEYQFQMDLMLYILISLLTLILSAVIYWLYKALMESSSKQATFGKMAMGIIVTDTNGKRISFANATGRHFASYISAFILFIGYIMAAFTKRKQALHDIMAGTYVIKRPQKDMEEMTPPSRMNSSNTY